MFIEQKRRSVIKTISWRFWATITTIALVFLFVGEVKIAFSIGGIEIILKMVLYFIHERVWNKLKYGKKEVKPAVFWFTGFSGVNTSRKPAHVTMIQGGIKMGLINVTQKLLSRPA